MNANKKQGNSWTEGRTRKGGACDNFSMISWQFLQKHIYASHSNLASPEQNNSKHVFMIAFPLKKDTIAYMSSWQFLQKHIFVQVTNVPSQPPFPDPTYEHWQNTKPWTFSKYRLSPQFMFKFLSNPNTGWEVISEKCQQCKCFNHCPIPQTQWKHMLVSSLTPYWPHLSCYHVTSHLNSPSKNVLSNYNILQDYNPNSHMSGRLKIHNWRRKYNSTFDY